MEVPQKVLNWLHRVLQPQYSDVQRAYNDAAITLGQWPSLRPSTDVFTFENGQSALLLRLAGTLPVAFRGATYSIPVTIWIPTGYPREPPMVFVTPTSSMVVRPGQHVSGEGRVYHPYLAGWRPDRSTVAELIPILQDIFAREPPVVATQAPPPPPQARPIPQTQNAGPPVPPLPPELNRASSSRQDASRLSTSSERPPALPPKPFQEQQATPPPPNIMPHHISRPSLADERAEADRFSQPQHSSRYDAPPPLPTQPQQPQSSYGIQQQQQPPFSPSAQQTPQFHNGHAPTMIHSPAPGPISPRQYQQPPYQHPPPQAYPPQQPPPGQGQYAPQPVQPRIPSPPPDLLTDPFDPSLPIHSEPLPAPPIPPNPEKDALLQALSHTLTSRLHSALHTNDSAIPPLRAQNQALNNALANLQREQHALTTLGSHIASNTDILNQAMRDADACIARAQTASAPGVDEVFVAPTVVGQQVYELVAEVQAIAGTREVLSRALDRGRIGAESWVKSVRGLAREEFLKRTLIEKAARGMGLHGSQSEHSGYGREGGWV